MRITILRTLLAVYFVASVAVAFPVALGVGRAGELAGTTSGKVLAAAILALAVGALLAAADPERNKAVILVLIVFTALAALAIVARLATHNGLHDPAAALLPFVVACAVLLGAFYPRSREGGRGAGA